MTIPEATGTERSVWIQMYLESKLRDALDKNLSVQILGFPNGTLQYLPSKSAVRIEQTASKRHA